MVDAGRHGTFGSAPEDGPEPRVVGTVADEAARLVELLADRASRQDAGGSSERGAGGGATGAAGAADSDGPADASGQGRPRDAPSECTCGGRMPACRICPVCQVISLVSQISPETIDRVADFIDIAATALRDLATAQRDQAAQRGQNRSGGSTRPAPGSDMGDDAGTTSDRARE